VARLLGDRRAQLSRIERLQYSRQPQAASLVREPVLLQSYRSLVGTIQTVPYLDAGAWDDAVCSFSLPSSPPILVCDCISPFVINQKKMRRAN
jgi:hypothetical protein